MARFKLRVLAVVSLLFLILSLLPSSVSAGFTSFEQLAASDKKEMVIKIGSAFKAEGYSDAAVSGILGNINQESGFEINLEENGATVTSQGAGFGLIQWTGGRRTALESFIKEKFDGKNSLEAQVAFFVHETETSHAGVFARKRTGLGNLDATLDQYYKEEYSSWDDFKKAKDVNSATAAFMAFMEVPGLPHWENRGPIAEGILKNWAKEFTGGGASDSEGESKDTSSDSIGNDGGLPDEWDLVGLTKRDYMYHYQNDIDLPDEGSLSIGQKATVASIKEDVVSNKEFTLVNLLRTVVAFIGIWFFIWAMALIIAYLFDRSNVYFELSLVSVLTFGSVTVYALEDGEERSSSRGKVFRRAGMALIIGFVLISGTIYIGLSSVIYWIDSLLSSF